MHYQMNEEYFIVYYIFDSHQVESKKESMDCFLLKRFWPNSSFEFFMFHLLGVQRGCV